MTTLPTTSNQEGCRNMRITERTGLPCMVLTEESADAISLYLPYFLLIISANVVVLIHGQKHIKHKVYARFSVQVRVGHLSPYVALSPLDEESRIGKIMLGHPYYKLGFKRRSSLTKISLTTSPFHLLSASLPKYSPQLFQKIRRKKLQNKISF